jgi:hypothetical protein
MADHGLHFTRRAAESALAEACVMRASPAGPVTYELVICAHADHASFIGFRDGALPGHPTIICWWPGARDLGRVIGHRILHRVTECPYARLEDADRALIRARMAAAPGQPIWMRF